MKIKIPSAVSSRVVRQVLIGKKHSPTILFAGGVVGMVATTVTACRATLKVEEVLVDLQKNVSVAKEVATLGREDYTETDLKKDLAVIYIRGSVKLVKMYAPSIILGGLSIAALTGSHKILSSRNAGLAAAYAAIEKGFNEYRARVVDEYGVDKDRELRYGTETNTIVTEDANGPKKTKVKTVSIGGVSIYAKLFDEGNQNWSPMPEYNVMFIRAQQNYANDRLRAKGHLFLNDVYDMLGFERTPPGAVTGWLWDKGSGDDYIDFGVFNDASLQRFHDFVTGREGAVLLDFNVDGTIWDKI